MGATELLTLPQLVERARALAADGRRRVLGIAGGPGAGKSTLAAAIAAALAGDAVLVGMDGFHLANRELERLGRRDRKGAPDTFDAGGFVALLDRVRRREPAYAPEFDRSIEASLAGSVLVPAEPALVITEGNYLLLDDGAWAQVRARLDEAWFLDVDPAVQRERLVVRARAGGRDEPAVADWVGRVDLPNAAVIDGTRSRADLVVRLAAEGGSPAQ